jgi:hypothetical protein
MQLTSKLKDFNEIYFLPIALPQSIKRGKISAISIVTFMVVIWTLCGTSLQCYMAEMCDGAGGKMKKLVRQICKTFMRS